MSGNFFVGQILVVNSGDKVRLDVVGHEGGESAVNGDNYSFIPGFEQKVDVVVQGRATRHQDSWYPRVGIFQLLK